MTTLEKLSFEPDTFDTASFALARVMSPMEVRMATRDRPVEAQDALAGRWMVCGDLKADAFDCMTARGGADLPWRLSAFTSTQGVHYAVITLQLEDYQHRFMLPAWSATVRAFIKAAGAGEGYGFMFGREGGDAAFVVFGRATREMFGSLREFSSPPDNESLRRGITELPRALGTLGRPDAIPSILPAKQVKSVSVSVAVPPLNVSRAKFAH